MDSMYNQIIKAGAYRMDSLVYVQLDNGSNFCYFSSQFDLLKVLERKTDFHRKPFYLQTKRIQKITGLNMTAEKLYPHHTLIILNDTLDQETYAFPLFTEISIKLEKLIASNHYRFTTKYSSLVFPTKSMKKLSGVIPETRWIRFSRLKENTGLTAVTELTVPAEHRIWNPIAVIPDRIAEVLRMEILLMGADLTYEGDEGGYHFCEYNIDNATCQYIMNHSSFLSPKVYT